MVGCLKHCLSVHENYKQARNKAEGEIKSFVCTASRPAGASVGQSPQ